MGRYLFMQPKPFLLESKGKLLTILHWFSLTKLINHKQHPNKILRLSNLIHPKQFLLNANVTSVDANSEHGRCQQERRQDPRWWPQRPKTQGHQCICHGLDPHRLRDVCVLRPPTHDLRHVPRHACSAHPPLHLHPCARCRPLLFDSILFRQVAACMRLTLV